MRYKLSLISALAALASLDCAPAMAAAPTVGIYQYPGGQIQQGQGVALIPASSPSLGYQQTSSVSTAVGLPSIPAGAKIAVIVPETQSIRWRDDGTSPTASVGMPISALQPFVYTGVLSAFKMIQTSATATVNVTYY